MSELMKRYEKEKFEKNLPKEKNPNKLIIAFKMGFLILSSVLFVIYIMNHHVINIEKVSEFVFKNLPLIIGSISFVFVFTLGVSLIIEYTNMKNISDVIISFVAIIITTFIFSAFYYFIVYILTFRWLVK